MIQTKHGKGLYRSEWCGMGRASGRDRRNLLVLSSQFKWMVMEILACQSGGRRGYVGKCLLEQEKKKRSKQTGK